jgi:DNA-binding CsgD family transcriptional regulator
MGRDRDLTRLGVLLDAVAGGKGQLVVLTGEAGIGKSRLAAAVSEAGAGRGFAVFCGVADEVEQRRPFGVLLDALEIEEKVGAVWSEVSRLMHGDGPRLGGDRFSSESRVADLLVSVVDRECGDRPVVLVLDDLQWADESSLVAVHRIARLADSRPVLLVCVLRPYPFSPALRALLAALDYRHAHRLDLKGLPTGVVAELAGELAGAPPGESVRRALAETGGNPFYVNELLACLLREGRARVSEQGSLELATTGLPPSLRFTILEQLRFVPDLTLEALRAATVAGRAFSVADVGLIARSAVADVVAVLDPALRAGVLVAEGGRLAFRHDLIREAIYEDMVPAVRMGLHRELASRLAETGAPVERVAAQLMLGATAGDMEAVGWLRRAAAEVAASSPAVAAELLSRALDLSGERARLRGELLGELVRPLLWTAQAARAERVCEEGLALEHGEGEPLFRLGLATARLLQGRFLDARESCREGADWVRLDQADRLYLDAVEALCGVYLGDEQGLEKARQIVATAPRSHAKGTAQEAIAQWELFCGHADRALAAFDQVDSMREPVELESRMWQESGVRVRMWHALALLDLDRIDDAAELLERELDAKLAVPALPHAFLAACHYHAGRFEEAVEECRAAVAGAQAVGSFLPASAPALAATIALRQGRMEEAEWLVSEAERARVPGEAAGDTIARWTRTLLLEASGKAEDAADAADATLEAYLRAGFASYVAWHAPDLVRVALHADRPDQAERAVQAAERAAAQLPVASRRAGALRARGLLTGDSAALLDAVAACRQAPRPLDLALSLRDAAVALASSADQGKARAPAVEALELLCGLGADGDERRARALLRAAGLRLSARAKHTHARDGWESLTNAERRVVALAVEGRSNPEIAQALYLSRRTVRWHISNVFRKLDISSRVELVAEALRRERR